MDTVLNLGLNDRSVEGLARQTDDERFAYDSYRRFVSMYGRIVLDIARRRVRRAVRRGQGEGRHDVGRRACRPSCLVELVDAYKGIVERHTGAPFPQDPTDQLRGRHRGGVSQLERRPRRRLPRARAHRPRPRHRRQRPGDGVRQPRRPVRHRRRASPATRRPGPGAPTATSWSTPRARTWSPASATPSRSSALRAQLPEGLRRAARDLRPARAPLPRHVRHRVHDRAGQALDAADARRQAHRPGRAADGGRDDEGTGHRPRARPRPCRGSPRTTSTRCCTRSSPTVGPRRAGQGARRLAGRGGRAGLLHRRRRGGGRRPRRARDPGAPRDLARGRPRDARRRRDPHVARRPGQPRGGRRARLGQARRRRRRGPAHRGALVRRRWRRTVAEGDWLSIDGGAGTVVLGPGPADRRPSRPRSSARSCAGPTRSARGTSAVRANADTGADAANARRLGAEGIGLCRTEHMFLGEDRLPIVRRMILADTPEEETAALEELRVAQRSDFVEILEAMDGLPVTVRLLDPPLHEFLPVHRGAGREGGDDGPRRRGARASTRRRGRGRRPTRCSAPAACGSAWSSPASTRCRCAR